jgi:hypothetical protein
MTISYEKHMLRQKVSSERRAELEQYALDDAKETFLNEQMAHWGCNVLADDPPEPQFSWLSSWLNGEHFSDAEWSVYEDRYLECMTRAIRALDRRWDEYVKLIESDPDDCMDIDDLDGEITDECIAAME